MRLANKRAEKGDEPSGVEGGDVSTADGGTPDGDAAGR